MIITEQKGMYYKIEGDDRWRFDFHLAEILQNTVPYYWEDTCPSCGNKDNISGCRCAMNHRTCPICGAKWHWVLDKTNACMKVDIEKIGTLPLTK